MFTPRVTAHGNHAFLLVSQTEPGKLQRHQLLLCFRSAPVLFFLPVIQAVCKLSAGGPCTLVRPPSKPSTTLSPILILRDYSAFLACSLKPGAVPSFVTFPFSISAAHSAAPTVFVNANRILATGTNSSNTAAIPKLTQALSAHILHPKAPQLVPLVISYLVYAALYSSICFSFCVLFHCFNWKYLECAAGPARLPCNTTNMTVPTTGMKFRGRYKKYLIIAVGVYF